MCCNTLHALTNRKSKGQEKHSNTQNQPSRGKIFLYNDCIKLGKGVDTESCHQTVDSQIIIFFEQLVTVKYKPINTEE